MSLPVSNNAEQSDDVIFSRLNDLPTELFERIIFRFNRNNIIPGPAAPHATRVVELIKLVHLQKDGPAKLWAEIEKNIDDTNLGNQANIGIISPQKAKELIGILIEPDAGTAIEDIARYSFAQIKNSINSDLSYRSDEPIVSALVWNLKKLDPVPGTCPELLVFAVLCHDYASGLKITKTEKKLKDWIDSVCAGTQFSSYAIRADFTQQDYRKVHRPAIEIAWRNPLVQSEISDSPTEAYIRWGRLRQRIDQVSTHSDRHKVVTDLLSSIENNGNAGISDIDHVELLLETKDMHKYWEYRSGELMQSETPDWQPYPLVVRLISRPSLRIRRANPANMISDTQIACSEQHKQSFLEIVQDNGFFVASNYMPENNEPCQQIKTAISWASIGIWTRMDSRKDSQLRQILVNCPIEDVPRRIHGRRIISTPDSVWRDVVVLFDPNLPAFIFSHSKYDSSHQQMTNAALG